MRSMVRKALCFLLGTQIHEFRVLRGYLALSGFIWPTLTHIPYEAAEHLRCGIPHGMIERLGVFDTYFPIVGWVEIFPSSEVQPSDRNIQLGVIPRKPIYT